MDRRWLVTPALAVTALVGAVSLAWLPANPDAEAGVVAAPPAPPEAPVEAVVPEPIAAPELEPAKRPVDLVIALDTSSSMDGLLDSTRNRVWDIVNEVERLEENADLRVSLVTFGTPDYGAENGFVKVRSGLTDDLDAFYGELMSLRTNGGDEYVGWALHETLQQLEWSTDDSAAHIVFVAGNESADQARGAHDFREVASQYRERGIVINALYAGDRDQGIRESWAELAKAGGGLYSAIDQATGTVAIETPQDQELARLNRELNQTYVPYGANGSSGLANMQAQDQNASGMGISALGSRIATKGSGSYKVEKWDLVEALEKGTVELDKLDESELPSDLQGLSTEEQRQQVQAASKRRSQLKDQIKSLSAERGEYLREAREKSETEGLDEGMLQALGYQL